MRRAVNISDGNWWTLVDSPLSIGLWTVAIVGFVLPILIGARLKSRMHMAKEEAGSVVD